MEKKSWSLSKLYYYLVSFATLMMIIVGTVGVINAGIDLFLDRPDPIYPLKVDYERRYEESGEKISEEEIEKRVAEERQNQKEMEEYQTKRRVLENIALIAVGAPVYAYHWRRARKIEE